ncbi:hypothetical protein AB4Z48_18230 [Cupriavidus sp. 2TAF22]|uniref:hypothetical protein n=1 Tax=unclassified Cupriavidus TaxID=2640874 RepID=UPI003F928D4F
MIITIDIETIPAQHPAVRAAIAKDITPPGNYKSAETIAKWEAESKPAAVEEAWRKTSFDGALGHLAVISVAFDDYPPATFHASEPTVDAVVAQERTVLQAFFKYLNENYDPSRNRPPCFVGHYVTEFDLRFIFQRAVVFGERPPAFIPFHAKPWDETVFDTMTRWAGARGTVKLDKLCQVFGFSGKGDIDGSKVWDYVKAGRLPEVVEYCADDVARARSVYKRLTFQAA